MMIYLKIDHYFLSVFGVTKNEAINLIKIAGSSEEKDHYGI